MTHLTLLSSLQEDQEAASHSEGMVQAKSIQRSAKHSAHGSVPGWWCQNFDPLWKPLVHWLRRQRPMTLSEFQLMTSRIPELPAIEKTIIISTFIAYKNMRP